MHQMTQLQTFRVEDLEAGRIAIPTHQTGKFARVRDITANVLKLKGDAIKYYELTRLVREELELGTPQEAYNYVRNALKPDRRFVIRKFGNKGERLLTFVVRVLD